jgi:hypothetical protein
LASAPKQRQLRNAAAIVADVPAVKAVIVAAKTADAGAKTAGAAAKAVIETTVVPKKNQNLNHYI